MDEAIAIIRGGLGKAELEFVASLTAPLFWMIRNADGTLTVKNGSAFFLDAGQGAFGVTANHVIAQWKIDCEQHNVIACRLGGRGVTADFANRTVIDAHEAIDIATFTITEEEVTAIGHTVLTGYQKAWPPGPPHVDKGIYYCGFPGVGKLWLSPQEISFGCVPASGVASSVSEQDVSTLIERQYLMPALGDGIPPENFDFGGISGGPMLIVIEKSGIRTWALGGVIYQGPNPSPVDSDEAIAGLEIIRARRAHFILPNGQLDRARWSAVNGYR